jgi:hypothetical protein
MVVCLRVAVATDVSWNSKFSIDGIGAGLDTATRVWAVPKVSLFETAIPLDGAFVPQLTSRREKPANKIR